MDRTTFETALRDLPHDQFVQQVQEKGFPLIVLGPTPDNGVVTA